MAFHLNTPSAPVRRYTIACMHSQFTLGRIACLCSNYSISIHRQDETHNYSSCWVDSIKCRNPYQCNHVRGNEKMSNLEDIFSTQPWHRDSCAIKYVKFDLCMRESTLVSMDIYVYHLNICNCMHLCGSCDVCQFNCIHCCVSLQ